MSESPREDAAVQKLVQLLGHERRQSATGGLVRPPLLEGQQVPLQHLVERRLLRLPTGIGVLGRRTSGPLHGALRGCHGRAGRGEESLTLYARVGDAARAANLGINAGHDLSLENLGAFLKHVKGVDEVSIGHALIADALELGMAYCLCHPAIERA